MYLKNSKTVRLGTSNGVTRFVTDAFIGAVQMSEDGIVWQDIKPRLVRDTDGWHVDGAPYHSEVKDNGARLFCPDKRERSKYISLPSVPLLDIPKGVRYSEAKLDRQVLPNKVVMPTPWGEIVITCTNTGLGFQALITQSLPRPIQNKFSFDIDSVGFDIRQLLSRTGEIGTPRPRLIGSNIDEHGKYFERFIDWSYRNGRLTLDLSDLEDLGLPVLFKNATIEVGASADDGGHAPSLNTCGTELSAGYHDQFNLTYNFFARFDNATISGDTVDVGYLSVYKHSSAGSPELQIDGIDEDDPNAPTSSAEYYADTKTTANTQWDGTLNAGWNNSPSIVSIIQELKDDYGISNEAIMFQVNNDIADQGGTSNDTNQVKSYDYDDNSYGPKLHVESSTAGWGGEMCGVAVDEFDGVAPEEIDGV
jgi:hypothetical protein